MPANAEKRYAKADPKATKESPAATAKPAERKPTEPAMTKTPDANQAPIAGGVLSEVFKRHLDERRQTHTRHEREHREMGDRHMRELGGTLSMSDVVDASGVGGAGGESS